ncbi:hypothetical protein Vretimale_15977 [Volvox reticuliferus]|uniref:Uncharacterized protein n=1 Tax=Volvox reticuliferus TaxID=1737510 RepID=A0A8J4CPX3_9CHLO|nr:hypothetical protein Vretifemale_13042 [Volvox reticuliferus]GIM12679.1 hypothetical protein Vretimale_15977 [Volvox reticuliferus]
MMINFIAYGSKSITVESVVPANRVRKPRVWRSAPSKPRNTCPSNSQHRAASANTSLPKPFATEQRATTPAEEAISWDCIYVGRMPLVGFEAVSAMMLPAVTLLPATLSQWFPLHSFLALGSSRSPEECMVIDFLPERPTHPTTALALASGGSVPGQLRVRRLRGWVRGASVRTRFVMKLETPLTDTAAQCAVEVFNSRWDPELRLLRNDCRHYTAALLTHLSSKQYGIQDVL